MGRVPGGLGVANVMACSVFAAMCGSSPATCSAIGSSGIPEMRKRGYSPALASGIIAAGGTLGILIPPSLTLILYGVVTEQSIGKLFIAGVGPGLLLTAMFAVWVVIQFRREQARAGWPVATARSSTSRTSPGAKSWKPCRGWRPSSASSSSSWWRCTAAGPRPRRWPASAPSSRC
jgi:tripartite ATP-independent transporter DctM subunit